MKYLFLAYLIINPLFFMLDMEFRQAQEWCFQLSGLAILGASLFFRHKEIKRDALNITIGIMLLWFLLIYILNLTGWSILLNFALGILIYLVAIKTLEKEDYYLLAKGFAGIFIFSIIFQATQALGFDIRGQNVIIGPRGGIHEGLVPDCSFFGLKASMGMYYAIVIAFLLPNLWFMRRDYRDRKLRIKIIISALISLFLGLLFVPLATSYSTSAYLAGVAVILFIFWFRKRILFWLFLAPLLIGAIFFIIKMDSPMGMMTSRLPMWGMVLQDTWKQPIFGYGLDSFRQPEKKMETHKQITRYYKNSFNDRTYRANKDIVVQNYQVIDWRTIGEIPVNDRKQFEERLSKNKNPLDFWDSPHNIYLWFPYETGFIGLGLFITIISFATIKFKRSKRGIIETAAFAAILSILVSGLTQFPFHLNRIAHTIPILGAIFYLATEDKYEVTA